MRDFRSLRVWHRSHQMVLAATRVLAAASRRRFSHVISQGQRAAHSVSANIVEGCAHDTSAEFARYLRIALASAHELEYHLLLSRDLGLIDERDYDAIVQDVVAVKKMLMVLIQRVRGERH